MRSHFVSTICVATSFADTAKMESSALTVLKKLPDLGKSTALAKMERDLRDLGLKATRVAPDQKDYPRCINPDDYHVATQLTNKETWWLATTTEAFESLAKDANGGVLNIPEGVYMPVWDKALLSTSPRHATETLFYHVTETHVLTLTRTKVLGGGDFRSFQL